MKQIKLYGQYLCALCDDTDFELLNKHTWFLLKRGRVYHAFARIGAQTIYMHQLVMPSPSVELLIDHKNTNGLDNQRENLRYATQSQNIANSRKQINYSSSQFKGVSFQRNRNRWTAQITVDYKKIHLDYFDTEKEAAIRYNRAAKEYFGEFARINKFTEEKVQ